MQHGCARSQAAGHNRRQPASPHPAHPELSGHRRQLIPVPAHPPATRGAGPLRHGCPRPERLTGLRPRRGGACPLDAAPDPLHPDQHHRPATGRQVPHPRRPPAMQLDQHPTGRAAHHRLETLHACANSPAYSDTAMRRKPGKLSIAFAALPSACTWGLLLRVREHPEMVGSPGPNSGSGCCACPQTPLTTVDDEEPICSWIAGQPFTNRCAERVRVPGGSLMTDRLCPQEFQRRRVPPQRLAQHRRSLHSDGRHDRDCWPAQPSCERIQPSIDTT